MPNTPSQPNPLFSRVVRALKSHDESNEAEGNDLYDIAHFRELLAANEKPIDHVEFGALDNESAVPPEFRTKGRPVKTTVAHGATIAATDYEMSRDLYRLVFAVAPERLLEIGTCIGVSGLYIATAARRASSHFRLATLEGGSNRAAIARENLKQFGFTEPSVTVIVGRHEQILPVALKDLGEVDFAFVDGSHIGEEVIDQHRQILAASGQVGIIVHDDIDWSRGMTEAWSQIKASRNGVTHTIDCGRFGVCLVLRDYVGTPTNLIRNAL